MVFNAGVCWGQNLNGFNGINSLDLWQSERPVDMAKIQNLDVMCGKQHMEVTLTFDRPFNGIVFSKVGPNRNFSTCKNDVRESPFLAFLYLGTFL